MDFNPEYPPIRSKNSEISVRLENILKKGLAVRSRQSVASAVELQHDLDHLNGVKPKRKPRVSKKEVPVRLRAYAIAASVVLVLGSIGAGIYYLVPHNGTNQPVETGMSQAELTTSQPMTNVTPSALNLLPRQRV